MKRNGHQVCAFVQDLRHLHMTDEQYFADQDETARVQAWRDELHASMGLAPDGTDLLTPDAGFQHRQGGAYQDRVLTPTLLRNFDQGLSKAVQQGKYTAPEGGPGPSGARPQAAPRGLYVLVTRKVSAKNGTETGS